MLSATVYRDRVLQDWEKPETIPDPDATKPSDWDEDMDGEWEPAMIANPEYQVHQSATVVWWGHLSLIKMDGSGLTF